MFCLIEWFFKFSCVLKSVVYIILVKKGMELMFYVFFIYKIEGKIGVWDVKINIKVRVVYVK